MIKQSIRLVGCIIALFALILVFKHSHLMQEEKPLNTTERFNIAVFINNYIERTTCKRAKCSCRSVRCCLSEGCSKPR